MSRSISLFSGYSQQENRTTNYCLLVLKMLYDESPRFFAEAMENIFGENVADHIGITFRQQERKEKSVPDGVIMQKAVSIYIETKNFDWFHDAQLEAHLEALNASASGLKILLAMANFEHLDEARFENVQRLCRDRYKGEVSFATVSFEDFITKIQQPALPKNLQTTIGELRSYLDETGLLPSWRNWLDVMNCGGIPDDILKAEAYMCPATDGVYSHHRCRFFGMYRHKRVERIADILAVVEVDPATSFTKLLWNNSRLTAGDLKNRALRTVQDWRPGADQTRVFLLGAQFDTDFEKDSPGGMRGPKQYFDVSRFAAADAEQLARSLAGRKWSDLSRGSN